MDGAELSLYQNFLLLTFFIIGTMICLDENVGTYLILKLKTIGIKIQSIYWMIRLHPRNPIANYMMKRKYEKVVKSIYCPEYDTYATFVEDEHQNMP